MSAGVDVKIKATSEVAVNTKAVQINDSDSEYTVKSTAGGYGTVSGITDGAFIEKIESGVIVIPDAAGTFTFGDDGKYDFSAAPTLKAENTDEDVASLKEIIGLTADQSVTIYQAESGLKVGKDTIVLGGTIDEENGVKLVMNAAGNVASVKNLQGEISGLTSGALVEVVADSETKINTADLKVNKAVTAHVKDSNGYDYVTGLKDGAEVTKAANVSFVTDGTGTFTFPDSEGGDAHAFEINGDTEVTINTGASSQVTEINGVASALIVVSQEESALKINGKAVDVNVAGAVKATLKVDANGVVEGIDGMAAGGNYNLPANVTIAVDPTVEGVKINTKDLKITGQDTVTVHTAAVGYDWVSGIKTGANVETVESGVSLVTDGAGEFVVKGHTYTMDDAQITLKTGAGGVVTEIAGLDADKSIDFSQGETNLTVNGKAITFTGAGSSTDEKLKLNIGNNATIASVENLRGNISDLSAGTFVQVTATDNAVGINGKALQTDDGDVTVHATANGYDYVTGLHKDKTVTTAPSVSLVTAEEGTFIFGTEEPHTFNTDDAQITLKTDANSAVTEIAGLDADKYLKVAQNETGLNVNGRAITVTGASDGDEVKLVVDGNGLISKVENLKGNINGLTAGALVQAVAGNAVKINNITDELQASKDVTVRATAAAYDSVTGFTSGATFSKVKSGVILIPDTEGTSNYIFSGNTYSFSAKPTLVAGASNALASIGGLTSGQYVELQAEETALYIGANKIKLEGSNFNGDEVKFVMGDNNTVKSVENLKDSVSGLSAGALVQVKNGSAAVGINNKALQTTDDEVTVHATANGYDYVTGLSNNAAVTAAVNASLATDGAGTFVVKGHTYTTDDAQITLKTDANSAVTEIAGLDADKYIEFSQPETNLTVNGKAITFTGATSTNGEKLKLNIGNNATIASVQNLRGDISGLSAGALVDVAAGSTAKINSADLQVNQDVTAHVKDSTGYDYVTIKPGAVVTTGKSVSFVTDGAGTYTFGTGVAAHTFTTDDAQITLKTNGSSAVTEIAGLDVDKYVEFSQGESGLKINDKVITFTGAGSNSGEKLKVNIGNNATIASVENLRGTISDLSAGTLVQVKNDSAAVQINGVALQTTDGDVTVHATADGYDTVTGLSAGKEVTTAKQNATLVTDGAGAFTFDKAFTITDDNSVAFVMGDNNTLDGVYELDGKISGNFTEGLKVDGGDILITGDTAVDILADGSKVTKIEGLSDGANVQKSGGAETISTGHGTFTFGAKTYEISAGTADFLTSGDVPVVSGIKNLNADDFPKVTVYQNETALTVGDNTLKISNVGDGLKLTMNGDTIKTVDNVKGEVSGLSAGANVHVATSEKVTVNGLALQIDDSDFYVQTAANGYSAITGVAGNVTKAVNASIEINTANNQNYRVGTNTYTVNDDDKVTLVTDGNTSVTAVGGLIGKFKSDATTNKINGANVYSSNAAVWFVATDDNGISSVTDVTDGNIISVPSGVEVFVTGNNNTTVTDFSINGIAYHLLSETQNNISIIDRKVKGLAANARLTISGAEGNYVVNGKELYITPGRNVVIGEATGAHLYDPDAVDFSTFTPADEIVKRVFGENVAAGITPVENNADNSTTNNSPGAVIMKGTGGTAALTGNQQLAVVKAARNNVNISSTNDSVVASANVNVNLSGSTNARLMQTAGEMTVNGYDYESGAGIQISNADVIAAVKEKAVEFGDTISLGDSGPAFNIQTYATGKENIVNLYDITGKKKQTVHYANSNKTALTGDNSANVFVGSWSGTVNGVVITGGSGNDTAFGGAGDTFNLGNGENYLELGSNGATVELTATSGNTTVKGFGSSDIVKLNAARAQVYYTADGLIFTNANGQASLSIQDVTAAEDDGANGISYTNVLIQDINSDNPVNTAVAREGMAIKVQNDGATAYVGQNSGIDLTALNNGDINLDTGNGRFTFTDGAKDVTFRGITSIKGGSGDHELTGSATISNTLEAGTGACEIWGKGAANDLLIAADYTEGKKASIFRFESGDGNDTISNIQFYDSSGVADNDKMDVVSISGSASTSLSTSGNDVIIKYTDSGDTMTIKDAVNKKFKVSAGSESLVQIARNAVDFDGGAGFYYAAEPNSSLVVGSGISANETINLNGDGNNYTIDKNITIIDASAATNAIILLGNDNAANTIKAGTGGSTIYAGMRNYDDLIDATASNNVADLFQCKNAGNDTIIGAGANDTIEFTGRRYSRSMSILEYDSATGKKLVLGLSNTSKLTIDESNIENLTFKFSNQEWGWDTFKTKVTNKTSNNFSADLAEDYWENDVYTHDLLDGDADLVQRDSAALTFDNAENISYVDSNLLTGDIQFSVASGDQVYNFSELVDKRNK